MKSPSSIVAHSNASTSQHVKPNLNYRITGISNELGTVHSKISEPMVFIIVKAELSSRENPLKSCNRGLCEATKISK